ncbi:MAG: YbaK/EbsC family protein [Planctomycetota bacterium]|nr:YbaK/EbsC family protein [Planctomycetota bacterium]
MTVVERIRELLESRGISYELQEHQAVFTSQQAADVRGTSLESGAKALICKCDDTMNLFVMPANRRLASKAIRKNYGWKKIRFATPEEVLELTTLKPGSIPPFGSLFSLKTWCDSRMGDPGQINFNAGCHSTSISMNFSDYLEAENPFVGAIAE